MSKGRDSNLSLLWCPTTFLEKISSWCPTGNFLPATYIYCLFSSPLVKWTNLQWPRSALPEDRCDIFLSPFLRELPLVLVYSVTEEVSQWNLQAPTAASEDQSSSMNLHVKFALSFPRFILTQIICVLFPSIWD